MPVLVQVLVGVGLFALTVVGNVWFLTGKARFKRVLGAVFLNPVLVGAVLVLVSALPGWLHGESGLPLKQGRLDSEALGYWVLGAWFLYWMALPVLAPVSIVTALVLRRRERVKP